MNISSRTVATSGCTSSRSFTWAESAFWPAHVSAARASWTASSRIAGIFPSFIVFAARRRATLSALVPAQIHDLVEAELHAPESLRAIVIGGGALSPTLYARARALGWPLLPSYGLSELCSQAATAPLSSLDEVLSDMPAPELLSHVEAKLGDDDRLCLKSPALFSGYGLIDQTPGTESVRWLGSQDRRVVSERRSRGTFGVNRRIDVCAFWVGRRISLKLAARV